MLGCKLGIILMIAQQMLAQLMTHGSGYEWFSAKGNQIPCSSPLSAGWGEFIDNIYIGRAWYNGNLLPAKGMPALRRAFVGLNGKEYTNSTYEMLCGSESEWVEASNGEVPENAFPVGTTAEGNVLYYGRADFENGLHPGKVDGNEAGILIPFKGKEYLVKHYEVLVTRGSRRSFEDEY